MGFSLGATPPRKTATATAEVEADTSRPSRTPAWIVSYDFSHRGGVGIQRSFGPAATAWREGTTETYFLIMENLITPAVLLFVGGVLWKEIRDLRKAVSEQGERLARIEGRLEGRPESTPPSQP